MVDKDALAAELKKRIKQKKAASQKPQFKFEEYCFAEQTAFFRGEGSRFRTAVCSRRAGKTVGIAADMYHTCLNEPGVTCLYITVTKENARNIIWGDINFIRDKYQIDCKLDNLRLTVTFPNKSRIVIAGAKDKTEIEKYRGWKLRKCYIDECQSFRSYLKELINDVITPALRDLRGELYLTGTPGPVKAGVFFDYSHSEFWDHHEWTAFDNPFMHNPPDLDLNKTLDEERQMKGIDENDPSWIRETFGKWIEDLDSLVFKFNKKKNVYHQLPELPKGEKWYHIFGIDIGYNDSDAIAVLAYSPACKQVYLVDELVRNKQNITELVQQINHFRKQYDPIKMVIDAGALGKKIQEELQSRHGLTIDAAEKTRKVEFIELLNDDLRTEKLKCFNGSLFQEDCMLVQWDKESRVKNPDNPKISSTYHSDICDAVLYAWRECRHFLYEKPEHKPARNTDEYMLKMEEEEAERMEERKNADPLGVDHDDMDALDMDMDDFSDEF